MKKGGKMAMKKKLNGSQKNGSKKNQKKQKWEKPTLEDVSGKIMAQPYIRFT